MKIFVTGASGFIGAHTARALLDAGHDLRLLVRDVESVKADFARHGYALDDFVQADMRDQAKVEAAMAGCDAVFHAAALVSMDPRRADELYRNNVAGIDAVLGTACQLGIQQIVYVSSLSVLFQSGIDKIDENTPLGQPAEAYARSKRDCDEHVRRMQADGAPIQMTYPAGVYGPDDPKLSEGNRGVAAFLSSMVPLTTSGFQGIDVRDLAHIHTHLLVTPLQGKPTDARYIASGAYYPWKDLRDLLQRCTGRPVRSFPVSAAVLRLCGTAADLARRIVPFESQISGESMKYVTQWIVADSSKVLAKTGMSFRSGEETFSDTIAWLAQAGHLPERYAGVLASKPNT